MDLPRLTERQGANLEALANLRGETVEQTAAAIAANLMRSIPRAIRGYTAALDLLDVEAAGIVDGTPWVRTSSGRTFYDHPATATDAIMYVLLRDRLPRELTGDTFVAAANVALRYQRGARDLPENARVAVEAGCYVGFKPLAFADAMGAGGRVIAIEMMTDNFELLQRNVAANGLGDRVTPVHCALSDGTGRVTTRRKHKQQSTIAQADGFDRRFVAADEVPMDTLANVLDRTLPSSATVDLLNVQVNGAELAVLRGLGAWFERVARFNVASLYSVDGVAIREQVCDLLAAQGARIDSVTDEWVVATGPAG